MPCHEMLKRYSAMKQNQIAAEKNIPYSSYFATWVSIALKNKLVRVLVKIVIIPTFHLGQSVSTMSASIA
jgi:hypothetical protein